MKRMPKATRPGPMPVDADPRTRPGVPRTWPPAPHPGAHWVRPEQQRGAALLGRSGLREATPVFGTAQPPHGLSGAIRRAAYRVPEHRASRWALLVLADRVDVVGHGFSRLAWLVPTAAAFGIGYALVSAALERRSS